MKLLNKYTKKVIIEKDVDTIKELVEYAVENKISLKEANLIGADLSDSNLRNAELMEADLSNANLNNAKLEGANLNCIFYKTEVTQKQKEYIFNSDLFKVIENELEED